MHLSMPSPRGYRALPRGSTIKFSSPGLGIDESVLPQIRDDRQHWVTLVPEVFFSLGATELSGEAAIASREAARKKPLVPTDNNLTSMPTPISFD